MEKIEENKIIAREWYSNNKERAKTSIKRWQEANPDKVKEYKRKERQKWKRLAIDGYGGKCACCGEVNLEFLAIDHIEGGGNQWRKENKKLGHHLYRMLVQQGLPKGYRVLCHNCNFSYGAYGYCPHQKTDTADGGSK